MSAVLQLWSDVECNSGSIIEPEGAIPPLVEGKQRLSLDQRHQLIVRAPRNDAWLDKVLPRRVIRVETDFGETFEWRIASMTDGRANGEPVTEVRAEPIAVDLRDAVILRDQQTGGVTYHNLGGVNITAAQYIDTFILPSLTAAGVTWIARGTVDSTDRLDVSWDRASAMELIDRLATRLGLEWQLRRNGSTNYLIDLVTAINSSAASVLVAEKRNIISVQRERNRSGFSTVIVPAGIKPDGAQELAGIGDNSWKVSGVSKNTPTAGVDRLTLEDRAGGDDPIGLDDQFNSNYVEAEDGSLHEITDCTASAGTVVISSATNFATGDDVAIRLDATGTWMVELTSPTGTSNFGRVVGTFEISDQRGERNYVKNPWTSQWSTTPDPRPSRADGAQSSNATGGINLKGLPASYSFTTGDHLYFFRAAGGDTAKVTTSTAVAGATGDVTVQVSNNPALSDEDEILVWDMAGHEPEGWTSKTTAVFSTGDADDGMYFRRKAQLSATTSITGQFNGAHSGTYIADIDGLPAVEIQPGDRLVRATATGSTFPIISYALTTASGSSASLMLQQTLSATDNASVKIQRPAITSQKRVNLLGLPRTKQRPAVFQSPSVTVPKPEGVDTLWVGAGITLISDTSSVVSPMSGSVGANPKVQLWDVAVGSVLATIAVPNQTLTPFTAKDEVLRTSITVTGDKTLALRAYGIEQSPESLRPNVARTVTYVRWAQIHWGKEGPVPPIEGSHANRLWQEGNRELINRHSWLTTYEVSLRELTELWDGTPDEPNLVIGGTIRLKVPDMDIDVNVRVVDVIYDLINPANTRIVLDTRRERISRDVAKSKPKPTFTSVTVDTGATGTVTKVSQSSEDPPTVTGSRRAVSNDEPTASATATGSGTVTLDTITEFTLF